MNEQEEDLVAYEETGEQEEETTGDRVITTTDQKEAKGTYAGIHTIGFKDLLLKPELMKAITEAGFEHPSEVQQQCIPQAILGTDILCQAKSGMGKTAVFVLATLQQLDLNELKSKKLEVLVLVLCHTRELAFQVRNEYVRFAKYLPEIKTCYFYGGQPKQENVDTLSNDCPHILVGTPGRILQLVNEKILKLKSVKHFILDECDEMLSKLDMRKDVQDIFRATPHNKQVMMFSATFSKEVRPVCKKFMHNPQEIFVDDEAKLTLHGLQQHFVNVEENEKNRQLCDLLDSLDFNQVVIFVRSVPRARELSKLLVECNFPSICIHAGLKQDERIARYKAFKEFNKRIMVATDLFGRGIDIERVNIVINYDMPSNADAYLHRVGRAGRFGTKGLAITFATKNDASVLQEVQKRFEVHITELPEVIDVSSYMPS